MVKDLADYFSGSSLEYSPLSSPGSADWNDLPAACDSHDLTFNQPSMAMVTSPPLYHPEETSMISASTAYEPVMTTGMTTGYQSTGYQPNGHQSSVTAGYHPVATNGYQAVITSGYQSVAATAGFQSIATTGYQSIMTTNSPVMATTFESSLETKKEIKMPISKFSYFVLKQKVIVMFYVCRERWDSALAVFELSPQQSRKETQRPH
jgi:hypothetical protein